VSDLDSRAAIHDLVIDFYREVALDDLLGPVFGEVAEVDWSLHLPKLIDYWCRVLLGHPGYEGTMLGPHQAVHELQPLRAELFDRWYELFAESVDSGWSGPYADRAKAHAARIATTLARRILGIEWSVASDAGDVDRLHAVLCRLRNDLAVDEHDLRRVVDELLAAPDDGTTCACLDRADEVRVLLDQAGKSSATISAADERPRTSLTDVPA
jgi:hemoglobin